MGACSSSKGDINFCSTEMKEQELKCIACACGLGKGQLKRFLTAFRKVDVDERGVIYRHEFFDFFSVAKRNSHPTITGVCLFVTFSSCISGQFFSPVSFKFD